MDLGFALLKATIRKPMPAQTVIGQKINSRYIRFGIGMMTIQFRYGIVTGNLEEWNTDQPSQEEHQNRRKDVS